MRDDEDTLNYNSARVWSVGAAKIEFEAIMKLHSKYFFLLCVRLSFFFFFASFQLFDLFSPHIFSFSLWFSVFLCFYSFSIWWFYDVSGVSQWSFSYFLLSCQSRHQISQLENALSPTALYHSIGQTGSAGQLLSTTFFNCLFSSYDKTLWRWDKDTTHEINLHTQTQWDRIFLRQSVYRVPEERDTAKF